LRCKNEGKLFGLALEAEEFNRQIPRGRAFEDPEAKRGAALGGIRKAPEKAERLLRSGDMHALIGVACL